MVALPDKPSVVALIDVDKVLMGDDFTFQKTSSVQGNLMDILQQKFLKSIPFWDGTCSKDGRYELVAEPDDLSDIDIWISMSIIQIQVTEKYSTAMC